MLLFLCMPLLIWASGSFAARALVCSAQAVMSRKCLCYCAKAVIVLLWLEFFLTFFHGLLLLVLFMAVYCLFETSVVLSFLVESVVLSFLVGSVGLLFVVQSVWFLMLTGFWLAGSRVSVFWT